MADIKSFLEGFATSPVWASKSGEEQGLTSAKPRYEQLARILGATSNVEGSLRVGS